MRFSLHLIGAMMEFRYQEQGGEFMLTTWKGKEKTHITRPVAHMAQWLKDVLAVATVGGHIVMAAQPPPEKLLYFATDDQYNLIDFINLKEGL